MLIDGGYLERGEREAAGDLDELPCPPSIQVLLASRLDQLSVGERRAIERAAVEGTVFHLGRGRGSRLTTSSAAGRGLPGCASSARS